MTTKTLKDQLNRLKNTVQTNRFQTRKSLMMTSQKLRFYQVGLSGLVMLFGCLFTNCSIQASFADTKQDKVLEREDKTLDLLSRIDAFVEEDERLRMDAARAHYNMGNIYFQKGEYEIAAREYYQAVTLMPDDPDSHYNLAYVSSEYLKDFKTALKHYRAYLYLNPDARDAAFVREKLYNAELMLKNMVDSPLED